MTTEEITELEEMRVKRMKLLSELIAIDSQEQELLRKNNILAHEFFYRRQTYLSLERSYNQNLYGESKADINKLIEI